MKVKHVTIKDLAKHLNLSISTISRAFNDKYDIKTETRELILKAAEEIGYKPNPIARKLHSGQSFNIGVIVPELMETSFFTKAVTTIQKVLFEKGYHALIMQSMGDAATELELIKALESSMVDGIIISLTDESENIDYLNKMIEKGFPIVLFNRVCKEIKSSQVVFNDFKWAYFATEHLVTQGYKKIFHFSTPQNLSISLPRIKGYKHAMEKFKLEYSEDMIIESGYTIEKGEEIARKLLEQGNIPEAIFAASDRVAIGAIKVFRKAGYRVPEDIGVVGFSESSLVNIFEPSLTSVAQPIAKMGEQAALLMLKAVETDHPEPETISMSGKLNVRESSVKKSE
jgi:DNA-binding LacI/PurR family transcriptional regulator